MLTHFTTKLCLLVVEGFFCLLVFGITRITNKKTVPMVICKNLLKEVMIYKSQAIPYLWIFGNARHGDIYLFIYF